jgi:hypothetical protein
MIKRHTPPHAIGLGLILGLQNQDEKGGVSPLHVVVALFAYLVGSLDAWPSQSPKILDGLDALGAKMAPFPGFSRFQTDMKA